MADLGTNKAVVLAFVEAFSTEDWEGMRAVCTEDFRWIVPNAESMQSDQLRQARATMTYKDWSLEETLTIFRQAHDRAFDRKFVLKVTSMMAEGEMVAAEVRGDAVSNENGRHYENYYFYLLTLRDGRIAVFKEYQDTLHAYDVWMAS